MELKTVFRVHGKINSESTLDLGSLSKVIDNNRDDEINQLFAKGWLMIDMVLHIEDGVVFDVIYLVKDANESELDNLDGGLDDIGFGSLGSDIDDILRGKKL